MFVTTKKSMHFLHSTRGCSGLHCTNQAKFSDSRFCEFSVFCGRTLRCLVGALETSAPPWRVAWVWQGCHTLLSGFSPKPTLQPHFEYWVADDKLAWGIGGDKVFLCERFLQTCDIGSGAKTVLF